MINLSRQNLNLSQLRSNAQFNRFVELLETELASERQLYEDQPASEHQRGRVKVLAELIEALQNNHTGKSGV